MALMAQVPQAVSGRRVDPFRGYKFLVIDSKGKFSSAGFQTVEGLEDETEVVEYREGTDPNPTVRKLPGLTSYTNITLTRGKSTNVDFQRWRDEVARFGRAGLPDSGMRRELDIILQDHLGRQAKRWRVHAAWAVGLSQNALNAEASEVVVETLVVAHEGLDPLDIT